MAFAAQYPQLPTPLVDAQGFVTPPWHYFFQSLWNRTGAGGGTVTLVLDSIGNTPGDMLFREAGAWGALIIGADNSILRVSAGAPAWSSLSTLLDTLGNTVGAVLVRNGLTWSILAPGPAKSVLTSEGPGSVPVYESAASAITVITPSSLVGQVFPTEPAVINLSYSAPRVVIAAGAVTITTADYIVVVNKTVGAATAVALYAAPLAGSQVIIKDGKGDAAANNITITPAAGTIDGAATLVIAANYGKASLVYNGTQWNVI